MSRDTGLHRLLQFLGNPEGDLLARLDLDRLAGRRVPSHPGRPLPHLEMPSPVRRILSPLLRCRVVSVTKSPSTASACFFGRSWLSDKAAARCLSVMVACAAAFAGAADFLAAGAAFFAGGMTISLGRFAAAKPAHTGRIRSNAQGSKESRTAEVVLSI